jgi:lipopolysaccharide/colanic/teichoic acid biosynthesis glycosyltransferase
VIDPTVPRYLRARLVADRFVALVAGLVVAPVVAVLAVLVRREDGGPGLIAVTRVGRDGRPFRMWKLRSMRVARPDGTADGLTLSGAHDDRITAIGRRLRAYHLDELPQLLNVVRGEMGILGPRPETPAFVDVDDPLWQDVLAIPPGIAGPTQVIVNDWERSLIDEVADGSAYRSKVVPVKLAIDRWYLERSSPLTDALVAVTLVRRFLPGTESTTLKAAVFSAVPESLVVRDFLRERKRRWQQVSPTGPAARS